MKTTNDSITLYSEFETDKLLPKEYEELEYIERSTNQYIDTGLSYTECKRIVAEVELPNITSSSAIVAGWLTRDSLDQSGVFAQCVPTESGGIRIRIPSGWKTYGGSISRGIKYNVDSLITNNEQKLYLDNSLIYSGSDSVSNSSNHVCLFGRTENDTAGALRIYKLKCFTDNNVLLRDFIPCYRKSDGQEGLYDLVSDTFYIDPNNTRFVRGPLVNLPDEYQRVEYVEGTGTQYIDSGITPGSNTDIELKFNYTTTDLTSSSSRIFGSRGIGSSDRCFYIGLNNTRWYINYNNTSNYSLGIDWGKIDTNIHIIKNNGVEFYFDGTNVVTFPSGTFTGAYTAIIFGANSKGTILASPSRVYSCKIKQSGVLVANYIPCYRKSDNEIGLFNLVNGTFKTNAGEGIFKIGREINSVQKFYATEKDYDSYSSSTDSITLGDKTFYATKVTGINN